MKNIMKNIIYGIYEIMNLFTIGFLGWLMVYTIMNFTNVVWDIPTVMAMIAVVWTIVIGLLRYIGIYLRQVKFQEKVKEK